MRSLGLVSDRFRRFSHFTATHVGRPAAFGFAVAVVVGWAIAGPVFKFSTSWQLFINSFTTIVTFLMVFLIQTTQNRDSRALHLKLDELIRTQKKARPLFEDLEDASEDELRHLEAEFKRLQTQRVPAKHH